MSMVDLFAPEDPSYTSFKNRPRIDDPDIVGLQGCDIGTGVRACQDTLDVG